MPRTTVIVKSATRKAFLRSRIHSFAPPGAVNVAALNCDGSGGGRASGGAPAPVDRYGLFVVAGDVVSCGGFSLKVHAVTSVLLLCSDPYSDLVGFFRASDCAVVQVAV